MTPEADALLQADRITAALRSRWLGRNLRIENELNSTNALGLELLGRGVAHGAVIAAESQTAGRGRAGRRWDSPPRRNLLFSAIVIPQYDCAPYQLFSFAAALAVCAAVRSQTPVTPAVKWPNDIVVSGRKLGGILTEIGRAADGKTGLVMGVGLNVNMPAGELASLAAENPTSIQAEASQPADRSILLAECLNQLELRCNRLLHEDPAPVVAEWRNLTETLGHQVSVQFAGRQVVGYAEDIDDDGSLWVRPAQGTPEKIAPSEVRHLRGGCG